VYDYSRNLICIFRSDKYSHSKDTRVISRCEQISSADIFYKNELSLIYFALIDIHGCSFFQAYIKWIFIKCPRYGKSRSFRPLSRSTNVLTMKNAKRSLKNVLTCKYILHADKSIWSFSLVVAYRVHIVTHVAYTLNKL